MMFTVRSYVRWSYPVPVLQLSIRLQRYEKNVKLPNPWARTVKFIKLIIFNLVEQKNRCTFAEQQFSANFATNTNEKQLLRYIKNKSQLLWDY